MPGLSKEPYVTPVVSVDYTQLANLSPADGWNDLTGVKVLEMGLGWDKSTGGHGGLSGWLSRKVGSDLDGVAVFYVGNKPIKYLGWDELDCFGTGADASRSGGSATHTGDNTTGEGGGDDETVRLVLAKQDGESFIPDRVTKIVLTANAFKPGSSFARAKNITVTLYDSSGGEKTPVAWIEPSLLRPKNLMPVAVIRRKADDPANWELKVMEGSIDCKQGRRDDFLEKCATL
jgi:stress response protein SCP2